jgi:RND family efflux transporter MFP subunit
MLEEAIAQQTARQAELANAEAQLADAEYRLSRTRIRSPIDAIVERRLIAPGDFVVPGTPVVAIVGRDQLRANLPFPERLSGQLQPGLAVLLAQPTSSAESITGTVKEVRPMVGTNNRALEVIVELPPGTDWPPGGSVSARLVLANRESVVVPVECVVRRPAGDVVYVLVDGNRVAEREVTVGIRDRAVAEIVSGLQAGETVIASGAGFLTDGALVEVRDAG